MPKVRVNFARTSGSYKNCTVYNLLLLHITATLTKCLYYYYNFLPLSNPNGISRTGKQFLPFPFKPQLSESLD
jgi:hypothetical protein